MTGSKPVRKTVAAKIGYRREETRQSPFSPIFTSRDLDRAKNGTDSERARRVESKREEERCENSRFLVSEANSRNLSWSFSFFTNNPQRTTYNRSQEPTRPTASGPPPVKRGLRSRAEERFFVAELGALLFVPTLRVQVARSRRRSVSHYQAQDNSRKECDLE